MNDTVGPSESMNYGVNGKSAKANIYSSIFANFSSCCSRGSGPTNRLGLNELVLCSRLDRNKVVSLHIFSSLELGTDALEVAYSDGDSSSF